jgi:hypothetical protein
VAYTEFCCRSGGSNLNAGTRTGNTTVPGTAADFTYAGGSWVSGTGVFTVASGNPQSDGVAVGDFVSIYDQNNSLRCVGIANSHASCPDSAALSFTGDIDIRMKVRLPDWTPAVTNTLAAKYHTTGNQRSWLFQVNTTGLLQFIWSPNGTSPSALTKTSTVAAGFADGAVGWVRVTLDVDNGASGNDVKFYTSTDGSSWTQLGSTVTTATATSIFDSTAVVEVGAFSSGTTDFLLGDVYSLAVYDGIAGTLRASPDFAAQSAGTTSFNDAQGNTWTVGAQAAIAVPATTGFVARITAVSTTPFTASLTAKAGGIPNTGSGFYTAKIGGAWLGPNAYDGFPHNWIQNTLTNAAGEYPWIRIKNDQTYTLNAAVARISNAGPFNFGGFSTSYGDGGVTTFTGVSASSSFLLWEFLNATGTHEIEDIVFSGNGSASNATLVSTASNVARIAFRRCRFTGGRGHGVQVSGSNGSTELIECEIDNNNLNNSANTAGINITGPAMLTRCNIHDNLGSNTSGIILSGNHVVISDSIIESNGQFGINQTGGSRLLFRNVEVYNNANDGIRLGNSVQAMMDIENTNFFKNGGWAINRTGAGAYIGVLRNCSFGAGTQANTSGTVNNLSGLREEESVIYPANEHPWIDPVNGDFRLVHQYAMASGSGEFPGSTGTIGYPDRGAAQARRSFRTVGAGGLAG